MDVKGARALSERLAQAATSERLAQAAPNADLTAAKGVDRGDGRESEVADTEARV